MPPPAPPASQRVATRADGAQQCNVCLERFRPGATSVATLPCMHAFCTACLEPWLLSQAATCPVCRWVFPEGQTQLMIKVPGA